MAATTWPRGADLSIDYRSGTPTARSSGGGSGFSTAATVSDGFAKQ
ncbi:Uncharacterised protein [Mycobacteroides abscessus subsp. abscessus]|nr:Uncharacterised protein [Mycobacteroides abscessus subsp. abscessus]